MNARLPDTATLRQALYLTQFSQVDRNAAHGAMHSVFFWGGLAGERLFHRLWALAHHDTPEGEAARTALRSKTGIQIQLED